MNVESERRIGEDGRPLVAHPVIEPLAGEIGLGLGFELERDRQAPVGRRDGQTARAAVGGRLARRSGRGRADDQNDQADEDFLIGLHGIPPELRLGGHSRQFYLTPREGVKPAFSHF